MLFRYQIQEAKLIFSTEVDGTSLISFYTKAADRQPTLLMIKTSKDHVFGAFCTAPWKVCNLHLVKPIKLWY
jgi:hypothetical protein